MTNADLFLWVSELGIGYYPVDEGKNDYWFDKYLGYAGSDIEKRLMLFRANLVKACNVPCVIDVGIGSGAFIKAMQDQGQEAYGFDIDPKAVAWLQDNGLFRDPYHSDGPPPALCFWDSLEHIKDPSTILSKKAPVVFVSIPVFSSRSDALASKHFRPDEHYWYFSSAGLVRFMGLFGYRLLTMMDNETEIGREGIETFVFTR